MEDNQEEMKKTEEKMEEVKKEAPAEESVKVESAETAPAEAAEINTADASAETAAETLPAEEEADDESDLLDDDDSLEDAFMIGAGGLALGAAAGLVGSLCRGESFGDATKNAVGEGIKAGGIAFAAAMAAGLLRDE